MDIMKQDLILQIQLEQKYEFRRSNPKLFDCAVIQQNSENEQYMFKI